MEKVKHCRRKPVLTAFFFLFLFNLPLLAQRPSRRNQQDMMAGRIDPRVRAFVASCIGSANLPKPIQLYSQGAWFTTADLAQHVKDQGSDDDGTAQVWILDRKPRALSQWVHDDEFDRHTLACLDEAGAVTRLVNTYMPGLSEPELHWCFVHTLNLSAGGKYHVTSRYTGWNGSPIPAPKLTSEDRDFIAGERRYTQWKDFDFASAVGPEIR